MNDISIIFCTDLSVKESIKSTIGNWSKKGLLKNFIFIESYENNQFLASECINGQYIELLDLKRKLSEIELHLIRTVALTFPDKKPIDIQSFINYLNLPNNIEFIFLNTIIPKTVWHKNKILNSGTHLANANILVSPVDRPNPTRVPVDINDSNYSSFASINLISIASLWRGMEKGPFDKEEKNRQGKSDFIVTRNFVRVLLGPDPVDGLIDSLTTNDGKWITPNKDYSYPNNDLYLLSDFAFKIMDNFSPSFNFTELKETNKKQSIGFFDYFKRRYSEISFDKPLPFLSTKSDTVDQLNEYFSENSDLEIILNENTLNDVSKLSRTLVSSLSSRGETSLPKLWRDLRNIIFSLLDGSELPNEYSEFKQNIIINNVNSIVPKEKMGNFESYVPDDEEDSLEILTEDLEELGQIPASGMSFFDNFTNKLKEQSILALKSIRLSIQEILEYTLPNDEIVNLYKKLQKRVKLLDRILALYLLNLIIYFVNQILINGGFVDIILSIPLLDEITPQRILIFLLLLLSYWTYIIFKLFNIFKQLNADQEESLLKLSNASKQLIEFNSLLNQFKLWEEIYRLLIHESLDKRNLNLELDDSYIDFSPLLSIKGAVGSLKNEVIREIQMSIVKEGWFLDVYKQIENDFRKFSVGKILRMDENILDQIDSETTGFQDKDSVRYLFHKFLEEGLGGDSLKNFIQENVIGIVNKTDSAELFSETLNSGKSLSKFLKETEQSDSPSELNFDQNIWSNISRVFEVQLVDRLKRDDAGSVLFAVDSGSPIQRVIVRTDTSANVEKRLINNNLDDDQTDLLSSEPPPPDTETEKFSQNSEDY